MVVLESLALASSPLEGVRTPRIRVEAPRARTC